MVRTQIYLPKPTYEQLKSWAREENKSMAEKIRELLDQRLKKQKKAEPVLKLLMKNTFKGPRDLARNHDKYLYEK